MAFHEMSQCKAVIHVAANPAGTTREAVRCASSVLGGERYCYYHSKVIAGLTTPTSRKGSFVTLITDVVTNKVVWERG